MRETPEDVLKAWMHFVNTADVPSLLGLYHESAVLIPTFSNRLLNTAESIGDYFERLGSREDLSIALHEKTLKVQCLRDEIYALSGIYCWRFAMDGELFSFEARFSYMLDLALSKPIIHHHSSQIPRMI